MTNKKDGDPKIGYKHPPKHTQFKPGVSGNASGRPKRDAKQDVIENGDEFRRCFLRAINKPVKIQLDGKISSRPAIDAIFNVWINKALKGNERDIERIIKHAGAAYETEDANRLRLYEMLMDIEDARETPYGMECTRTPFYRKSYRNRKKDPQAALHDEYQPLTEEEWGAYENCLESLKTNPDAETWQEMIARLRARPES